MDDLIRDIEKMRLFMGISKRDLARTAEISEEYYWRIATGRAPGVAYSVLCSLSQAVGIKITYSVELESIISGKYSQTTENQDKK